jgi:hypothetical protein
MCSSGGLAVKRITSNDEIPGSSPGRSFSTIRLFLPFLFYTHMDLGHLSIQLLGQSAPVATWLRC